METKACETTKKRQREEDASEWEKDDVEDNKREINNNNNNLNWAETPTPSSSSFSAPTPSKSKSFSLAGTSSTSSLSSSSSSSRLSRWDITPVGDISFSTPSLTPSFSNVDLNDSKDFLTEEEIDSILPTKGYVILLAPSSYIPLRTHVRRVSTPSPLQSPSFFFQDSSARQLLPPSVLSDIPISQEDMITLGKYSDVNPEDLGPEELKERKIMHLLLKVKNGNPTMRKSALRQLTSKAREFGPGPLFDSILPLLLSTSLDSQERHLLVKVIDRVLFKLDDLVRPYTHKILVVVEAFLIDEDLYARIEGREIISNLSKAVGLTSMIANLRPDIDNSDECVRNVTSRAFAVVASALGIPPLIPFLTAVCKSKKSWQARHTGIKTVQQIAILMRSAVLPHLPSLVGMLANNLKDDSESTKVRTITALALAALAEASEPYGVESFAPIIPMLLTGIHQQRGKTLAAYIKALGFIIPLMEDSTASHCSRSLIPVLVRQFNASEPEMKMIILKVLRQILNTEGVEATYISKEVLPPYFEHMWSRRMALENRSYRQVVETAASLANKVGSVEVISRVVDDLKDECEQYRRMAMEVIQQITVNLGTSEIDAHLEERLVDGIMYAFQENNLDPHIMLKSFGTIINSLGMRAKPYIAQICGIIKFRLNNKSAKIRQQAADLIAQLAVVMKNCGEESLLAHLGVILYECLGEEFPEVLSSIVGALKSIVSVIGLNNMQPPIKDLLPRMVPILSNRHLGVQENCIDLVGRIADRGSEFVSAREWMRICFQLLDLIRAHSLSVRRAAVNTFGYIAKAIGPQDVMALLLNNLKVQERQSRVCTCIAIATVAEICAPYTVIPFLAHEYRTPELNVQNGVLKALSFVFEYIGEMAKDLAPLLEDALMDRDLVHRQIAANVVKHAALHLTGLGCEDSLIHLLNFVWPNVFETSPHVVNSAFEAIEALRVALGPVVILQYCLQGLFHPSRKVREVYWRIYNSIYIGAPDMLVPAWSRMEDGSTNAFCRWELDYVV